MDTEEIKSILKWVWIVLIALAVFLAALTLETLKNLRQANPAYNAISVSGIGEAVSIPDIAAFSFSVSADAAEVSDAQGQVTEKMDTILSGFKELGIEEKDIKTTDYSVRPKYTFEPVACLPSYCPPARQVQDGYSVSHSVSVKVRQTENAGEALALAGERGATNLSNLSLTVDDPDKILGLARVEAIRDARDKAEILSKELGVRLIRVVSFYDNTGREIPYYAEGFGGDTVRISAAEAPTIPIGENKVEVMVTITYEIR